MDACGSCLDHPAHKLKGVNRSAEPGLRVCHNGNEPVGVRLAFQGIDLVGSHQRVVESLDHRGDAVGGVEALVGVGVGSQVVVARHLPAAEVEGVEAALDHVHGLGAGQRAECPHKAVLVELPPQTLSAVLGQGVLYLQAAPQLYNVFSRIVPLYVPPSGVGGPALLYLLDLLGKTWVVIVHTKASLTYSRNRYPGRVRKSMYDGLVTRSSKRSTALSRAPTFSGPRAWSSAPTSSLRSDS